jgi:AraC-like DNA-binding protein
VAFPETAVGIRPARGPAFVADRNLVTFYDPDDEYTRWVVDPRGDHCSWIAPSPEVAYEFARTASLGGTPGKVFGRPFALCNAATFRRQRWLLRGLLAGPPPALVVEEEALTVLAGVATAGPPATNRRLAAEAREYLALNYPSAPALGDIAAAVGTSTFHLCRVFRAQYNTTLHAYRTDLAVRDAYDQIQSGGRRLLDIALDLGFASHSHFTAAFTQRFGVAPSSLRPGTRSH